MECGMIKFLLKLHSIILFTRMKKQSIQSREHRLIKLYTLSETFIFIFHEDKQSPTITIF